MCVLEYMYAIHTHVKALRRQKGLGSSVTRVIHSCDLPDLSSGYKI